MIYVPKNYDIDWCFDKFEVCNTIKGSLYRILLSSIHVQEIRADRYLYLNPGGSTKLPNSLLEMALLQFAAGLWGSISYVCRKYFFLAGNTSYTQVEFQNRPVKRYIMDASGVWSQGQDSVAGKAGCRHFLDWHDSAFTNVTRSSQYGVLWRELIHGWSRWNFIFSVFMDSVIFMMWKFALF